MATLNSSWSYLSDCYLGNWGYGNCYYKVYGKLNSQNAGNSTSNVTLEMRSYSVNNYSVTYNTYGYINGATVMNNQYVYYRPTEAVIGSHTFDVQHDSDGSVDTATIYTELWANGTTTPGRKGVNVSFDLPTIKRYASINNYYVNSIGDTSVQLYVNTDVGMNAIGALQYQLNNSGNWITVSVGNNINISNLSYYTNYNVKVRVKYNVSGLYTESQNVSFKTNGTPIIILAYNSHNSNSITLSYTWSGVQPTKVLVYNGDKYLGEFTSSPFTITGLTPNTAYSNLKAYAQGGSGYGPYSNSLAITTYPNTVVANAPTIKEITPFTITFTPSSSNPANTIQAEYTVYASNGTTVVKNTVYVDNLNLYTISGLPAESNLILSIRFKTSGSNLWSNKINTPFITTADIASIYMKIESMWVKGKLWIKVDGTWRKAKKIYRKINGTWVLGSSK